MKKYVVISKEPYTMEPHMNSTGKSVLMSFAQKPLWKEFYWIKVQKDAIPNYMNLKTAKYALEKYANSGAYEVVTYEQAQKEFEAFDYENQ